MTDLEDWRKGGVRISAWLDAEPAAPGAGKGQGGRGRGRGIPTRGTRRYPTHSTMPGSGIVVHAMASLSPYSAQTRGSLRSYLEREEAEPVVLQQAAIEEWLDRWTIWISAEDRQTGELVNTDTVAKVLTDELERRYGMLREDVYCVEHTKTEQTTGEVSVHVHAVVPALKSMTIERQHMAEIGREIVRALELERALERTMGRDM